MPFSWCSSTNNNRVTSVLHSIYRVSDTSILLIIFFEEMEIQSYSLGRIDCTLILVGCHRHFISEDGYRLIWLCRFLSIARISLPVLLLFQTPSTGFSTLWIFMHFQFAFVQSEQLSFLITTFWPPQCHLVSIVWSELRNCIFLSKIGLWLQSRHP